MKNKCLNCGRFPFCEICSDMHDEDRECFIKRKIEDNYVVRKEDKDGRIKSKIHKLKRIIS